MFIEARGDIEFAFEFEVIGDIDEEVIDGFDSNCLEHFGDILFGMRDVRHDGRGESL